MKKQPARIMENCQNLPAGWAAAYLKAPKEPRFYALRTLPQYRGGVYSASRKGFR